MNDNLPAFSWLMLLWKNNGHTQNTQYRTMSSWFSHKRRAVRRGGLYFRKPLASLEVFWPSCPRLIHSATAMTPSRGASGVWLLIPAKGIFTYLAPASPGRALNKCSFDNFQRKSHFSASSGHFRGVQHFLSLQVCGGEGHSDDSMCGLTSVPSYLPWPLHHWRKWHNSEEGKPFLRIIRKIVSTSWTASVDHTLRTAAIIIFAINVLKKKNHDSKEWVCMQQLV